MLNDAMGSPRTAGTFAKLGAFSAWPGGVHGVVHAVCSAMASKLGGPRCPPRTQLGRGASPSASPSCVPYRAVRFEDLIASPVTVLGSVYAWLGVAASSSAPLPASVHSLVAKCIARGAANADDASARARNAPAVAAIEQQLEASSVRHRDPLVQRAFRICDRKRLRSQDALDPDAGRVEMRAQLASWYSSDLTRLPCHVVAAALT
jgi:hypothetical protein